MDDRVALITGGSKGLGYAMATKFASCGAKVVVLARSEAEVTQAAATIVEQTGTEALGVSCDVSLAGDIQDGFDQAISRFGKIDILINLSLIHI